MAVEVRAQNRVRTNSLLEVLMSDRLNSNVCNNGGTNARGVRGIVCTVTRIKDARRHLE